MSGPDLADMSDRCHRVLAAGLPALRRVDPVQPCPLAGDLDPVAFDHTGRAGELWFRQGRSGPVGRPHVTRLPNLLPLP